MRTMSTEGRAAVRYLKSLAIADRNGEAAAAFASSQNWVDGDMVAGSLKAAVGDSGDANVVGNPVALDLVDAARPLTILGRLQALGLVRRWPFRTKLIGIGTGATGRFVGEGLAVPISRVDFTDPTTLEPRKIGAGIVVPAETLKHSSPLVEQALRRDLVAAVAEAEDRALLDATIAGSASVPRSLTHGGATAAASGVTPDDAVADLRAAIASLVAAGSTLATAAIVVTPIVAVMLATTRGGSDEASFPGCSAKGGTLLGLPLLVSNAAPTGAITLIDAGAVTYGEGATELRIGTAGMIELDDAPTGDSTTPVAASANRVSLFQSDAVALMVIRAVAWTRHRSVISASVTGVAYL